MTAAIFSRNSGKFSTAFLDAVVAHVIGCRLGSKNAMVPHILLDEPAAVVLRMTGLGKSRSSITVLSSPRYCLVTLRPKMVVILFGCAIVRLASSNRSPRASKAARRWKMRLSQYSTWAKKSRC